MNVELLVSLVSEHKELYDKFVWFWQARKYLLSSSEWQASVRSVQLRSATLCTGVFLFYIKHHLMSGNEFACSLGSSSVKIAWVWTQKTLANNARRYSSRCVRGLTQRFSIPVLAPPRSAYFICYSYRFRCLFYSNVSALRSGHHRIFLHDSSSKRMYRCWSYN